MRNTKYTYKLGKGCAMVEETLSLLSICDENTTKESMIKYVHENNFLSKCTAQRSQDIIRIVFFPRFVKKDMRPALWLKAIREKGVMLQQFKQLLMLYCARDNAVVYDYLTDILFYMKQDGLDRLPENSIRQFIDKIVEEGKAKWGEAACRRNASYIMSTLMDFDILNRRGDILPYEISNFTLLYLLHELHFEGLSDIAIWHHEDWKLFGLDEYDVLKRILEQNLQGGYIAQATGDLLTISWNYKTMEDFINGTL